MSFQELTEREKTVFISIVHSFVQTAEPVGSRYLTNHYSLNISPATVRNVMMDLEDKGLLAQPHTSAGRVPTNMGYRQYVNSIMKSAKLSGREKRVIVHKLTEFSKDIDQIVEKSTTVLSEISNQLGVILSPRFNRGKLNKINLVSISDDKLLVILDIKSGLVKTIIVEIDSKVPQSLLETTTQLLNERLHGLSVGELQKSLNERFRDVDGESKKLLGAIERNANKLVNVDPEGDFHFSGVKKVISQPDFESKEKIGKILELLDRKDVLVKIMSEQDEEGVSIVIGDENKEALMQNCSLITTTYQYKDAFGTLGVIGPTRMQYSKVIALVDFMAETLTYLTTGKVSSDR
ncbi:MAG: heat-inducible transcription repressor HrcA [Actinobacteria bacterium]|nr:heat-inducible transcription repressor HrcA [Actinomycetota bacterium]